MAKYDRTYTPFDFGILLSVYVSETDEQAKIESQEGIWYFLRNCLKGHLRTKGRTLTWGPGVPSTSPESWRGFLEQWQCAVHPSTMFLVAASRRPPAIGLR